MSLDQIASAGDRARDNDPSIPPSRDGGFAGIIAQVRAERIRLSFMRLSLVGVILVSALFFVWALPWIPLGMTLSDYDTPTAIALILAAASSVAVQSFIFVWVPKFQHDPLPEFLRVLMGAQLLLRGPQQFRSRLAAECRQGRADRRHEFSLIIVQVPATEGEPAERPTPLEQRQSPASLLVRGSVRAQDVVATSWPEEVWVLATAAGREARFEITRRLARSIADAELTPEEIDGCLVGGSSFGVDGDDSEALFAAARKRLVPVGQLLAAA